MYINGKIISAKNNITYISKSIIFVSLTIKGVTIEVIPKTAKNVKNI